MAKMTNNIYAGKYSEKLSNRICSFILHEAKGNILS